MKSHIARKQKDNLKSIGLQNIPVKDLNVSHQNKVKNKSDKHESTGSRRSRHDKDSLELNTFLNRFKNREKTVLEAISSGHGLTVQELEKLLELLPPENEMNAMKLQSQGTKMIDQSLQFFIELSEIPNYELKIKSAQQQGKCKIELETLSGQLDSIIKGCQFLRENINLTYFLSFVIYTATNIVPSPPKKEIKLEDIPYLLDEKPSEDDAPTYFHAVVDVAQLQGAGNFLNFIKKANRLKKLSRITIQSIEQRLQLLCINVGNLEKQLRCSEDNVSSHFYDFIEYVLNSTAKITEKIETVKTAGTAIAELYSQEPKTFKISNCFNIFADFFKKIERVATENRLRDFSYSRSVTSDKKLKSTKGKNRIQKETITDNNHNIIDCKNKSSTKKIVGKKMSNKTVSPYIKQL